MLSVVSARAKNEHLFTAAKVATAHGGLNIALYQSQTFQGKARQGKSMHISCMLECILHQEILILEESNAIWLLLLLTCRNRKILKTEKKDG